jgi:hypothetical protein
VRASLTVPVPSAQAIRAGRLGSGAQSTQLAHSAGTPPAESTASNRLAVGPDDPDACVVGGAVGCRRSTAESGSKSVARRSSRRPFRVATQTTAPPPTKLRLEHAKESSASAKQGIRSTLLLLLLLLVPGRPPLMLCTCSQCRTPVVVVVVVK